MIIAAQKKKENLAEYLLYMYQVEDLIRANGMDLNQIDQQIIQKFDVDYDTKREMREWYKGLIDRMQEQGLERAGHMAFLCETADQLHEQHLKLLHDPVKKSFQDAYDKARPHLEALRMRSGHTEDHDVQVALNGLYGLLILKLKQEEINKETKEAFSMISKWLAELVEETK